MTEDREFLRRLMIGAAVGSLFLIVAYIAVAFLAVLVLSIFLYYAVRPIFDLLAQFGLGRRIRAGLSIFLFGLPFVALIGYSVAVVTAQARSVLSDQGIVSSGVNQLLTQLEVGNLDPTALEGLIENGSANISAVADQLLNIASLAGGLFVSTLLVVTGTYYLLVDGPRFAGWFLDTYDDTGIVRNYAVAVDSELSRTLFGNVVNILITASIALVTFYAYNFFAPTAASVPFPALLAALAGIASLIPVIGIKIVYIPLCLVLAANAWFVGQLELLGPIAVLAFVSAVVVDFVPDVVVRAQISADQTHTGLLLVAYIVGPSVFGFYGLFLAPILLVATTNAVQILLPYALSGDRPDVQHTLAEYTDDTGPERAVDGSEDSV